MKDLLKLYSFYSVSKSEAEKDICDWLEERLKKLGVSVERLNNTLYHLTQDNKYLLSAHLDQVATNGQAKHFFKTDKGKIKAYNEFWQRTSLGADDKNGIWCILKLLERGIAFDFIISECEEIGGDGIKSVESLISTSKASIGIVLDRKGDTDILKGGAGSDYCEALAYNLKNFLNTDEENAYVVTTGSVSDTRTICKYIESVNMCVNYDDPHMKTETTNIVKLNKTVDNLERIIKEFVHYPAKVTDYYKEHFDYSKYKTTSQWIKEYRDGLYAQY